MEAVNECLATELCFPERPSSSVLSCTQCVVGNVSAGPAASMRSRTGSATASHAQARYTYQRSSTDWTKSTYQHPGYGAADARRGRKGGETRHFVDNKMPLKQKTVTHFFREHLNSRIKSWHSHERVRWGHVAHAWALCAARRWRSRGDALEAQGTALVGIPFVYSVCGDVCSTL